jgi:hypothetical protein
MRLALATTVAAVLVVSAAPLLATGNATATGRAAAHCKDSQLRVREGRADAAAGHIGFRLRFHNSGSAPCTLRGYPGAAGLNKHGRQVVQAKRTKRGMLGGLKPGHKIPTVLLRPGRVATAVIEGTDVPTQGHHCRTLHGLLVTPPNDTAAVYLKHAPPDCDGIQIHPVIKGKTGRQH